MISLNYILPFVLLSHYNSIRALNLIQLSGHTYKPKSLFAFDNLLLRNILNINIVMCTFSFADTLPLIQTQNITFLYVRLQVRLLTLTHILNQMWKAFFLNQWLTHWRLIIFVIGNILIHRHTATRFLTFSLIYS